MLAQAVGWFINLPEATAKRLAGAALKAWDWVKHLPTTEAQSVAQLVDAYGRLIEKTADAKVELMEAAARLAESNANAFRTKENTLAEVRHRDAETALLRVQVEQKRREMLRGDRLMSSMLSGASRLNCSSLDFHDASLDVHIGGAANKLTLSRTVVASATATASASPQARPAEDVLANGIK
jgi:hypothetical protein